MKKILCVLFLTMLPVLGFAQDEGPALQAAHVDVSNTASVQRGAKYFVNYCMSCHSAQYVRYNRVGEDLGLTDTQVQSYLMPAGGKISDTMVTAMPDDADKWFGHQPPDLSLEVRNRGADWVYTYLKSFYLDDNSKITGVNNIVFPHVAMPDVLWSMQGTQKAVFKTIKDADGATLQEFDHFEQVTPGRMTPAQFDKMDHDLTNFLAYISEPTQLEARSLGLKVIGFLIVFFLFAFMLKREIWKKVH
jgi:ubiquinol-cytochrome c reductase cytochrome c1 subunit